MAKPTLLLSSLKAHESLDEIEKAIQRASGNVSDEVEYGFALAYHALKELTHRHSLPHVRFGALHMNSAEEGAFTQLVAAKMLKGAGATFVLVGSDFDRRVLGEDDAAVSRKIKAALDAGITPVLCVGEGSGDYLEGRGPSVVERQLKGGLEGLSPEQIAQVAIFFESPWMAQLPYSPTVEQVTKEYQRDSALLELVVGKAEAAAMQVIHAAPDDLAGFVPPTGKGVYIPPAHAEALSEKVKAEKEQASEVAARSLAATKDAEEASQMKAAVDEAFEEAEEEVASTGFSATGAPFQAEEAAFSAVADETVETDWSQPAAAAEGALAIEEGIEGSASIEEIAAPPGEPPSTTVSVEKKGAVPPPFGQRVKPRKEHKVSDINE